VSSTRADEQPQHGPPGETGGARQPNQRARQKAETRRRLLEAAAEVFLEGGPMTTSLDAVAATAGVSRPTLFFHFGNRLELMDQLVKYLLETRFHAEAERHRGADLRAFLAAYLRSQRRRETRLLWQLGDALQLERPDGPNLAYWGAIREIEQRLTAAGHDPGAAHARALVLAPGLMLVARRAAFDLATDREMKDFVEAACDLALGPGAPAGGKS
jgi:AcrR family transcriptional regulator